MASYQAKRARLNFAGWCVTFEKLRGKQRQLIAIAAAGATWRRGRGQSAFLGKGANALSFCANACTQISCTKVERGNLGQRGIAFSNLPTDYFGTGLDGFGYSRALTSSA